MILLDTCTLIWMTLFPEHLSDKAKQTIKTKGPEGLAISSISIWEVGIKLKKGHLIFAAGLTDYLQRLKKIQNFYILPVDETIWVKNIQLDWKHQDPADRTIVATALHYKIPLITKDKLIRKFYQKTIW